jgi:hypothetical protein
MKLGIWKNKKNNELYKVLDGNVMDCTNSANEKRMVLYINFTKELQFVREYEEFLEKFTFISN